MWNLNQPTRYQRRLLMSNKYHCLSTILRASFRLKELNKYNYIIHCNVNMDLFLFIKIFTTILFTSSIVSWNVLWNQCRYMATTFAMEELPTTWIYGLKHKNLYVLMNVVVIKLCIVVFYSILLNNLWIVEIIGSNTREIIWSASFVGTTDNFQALLKGIFS